MLINAKLPVPFGGRLRLALQKVADRTSPRIFRNALAENMKLTSSDEIGQYWSLYKIALHFVDSE